MIAGLDGCKEKVMTDDEKKKLLCALVDKEPADFQVRYSGGATWTSYDGLANKTVVANEILRGIEVRLKPVTVTVYVWRGADKEIYVRSYPPVTPDLPYYTFEHEVDEDKL